MNRKTFKIYYSKENTKYPDLAGTLYKPKSGTFVTMSSGGVFFLVYDTDYYTYVEELYDTIGLYDIVWDDEEVAQNEIIDAMFELGC